MGLILVNTIVEDAATLTNSSPSGSARLYFLRLAASILLLVPAIWFSFKTVDGLAARRILRTDLAEITHARYGILSADQWRTILGPILNAQVDKIDLRGQSKSLRPMVERSLYALLDNIKAQMTAPAPSTNGATPAAKGPAPALKVPALPAKGNAFVVNMIVASLRPHVPEYTDVVMKELVKPATQKAFKDSIRGVLDDAVKRTFSGTDMTGYNAILGRYGCANGAECEEKLTAHIQQADSTLTRDYLIVIASAALAFLLLIPGPPLTRSAVLVLMLFSIALLVGGVLSPMLEVEVRVTQLDATLLGSPIEFREQSLYYRSKTVLEVFDTLIHMGRPEMTLVAVLLILFSVVFPALKMLALAAALIRPALLHTSRLVKLLAFQLSKWSMADVMALAIFMAFVAFNGVVGSSWSGVRSMPNVQQVSIPTDASRILPGYYLFVGFCLAGIILSKKLESGIRNLPQS